MGAYHTYYHTSLISFHHKMIRNIIVLALVATALAEMNEQAFEKHVDRILSSVDMPETEENLLSVAQTLHRRVPAALKEHTRIITKHAALIQQSRAKAYAHDFKESKRAIAAALGQLNVQLRAGHHHDKKALSGARTLGNRAIHKAVSSGNHKCNSYKHKSCPTKRAELEAKAKKDAAARAMSNIGHGKVCSHIASTTFGDMDIDKATPAYGTGLRNSWDKTRARYVTAHKHHSVATKAYNTAKGIYDKAMASLSTAIRIEASNAHAACHSAHREYNALVKDVQSNVHSRKQVWIATLVVGCYMKHLTSNSAAKACSDRKSRSSTAHWNIHAGKLSACSAKATLAAKFGPTGWKPSTKACHHSHWNAGSPEMKEKEKHQKHERHKKKVEKAQKESGNKRKERNTKKEKEAKKAAELKAKEGAAKTREKADKTKEKAAKAAKKEKSSKAYEKKSKADKAKAAELKTKEGAAKAAAKAAAAKAAAAAKEKANKAAAKHAGPFKVMSSGTCKSRVAESACKAYATSKGYTFHQSKGHANKSECFLYRGNKVYFTKDFNGEGKCAPFQCLCPTATASTAMQTKKTGTCNKRVSESSCKAFAASKGFSFHYSSGHGNKSECFLYQGNKVYFNKHFDGQGKCHPFECVCPK